MAEFKPLKWYDSLPAIQTACPIGSTKTETQTVTSKNGNTTVTKTYNVVTTCWSYVSKTVQEKNSQGQTVNKTYYRIQTKETRTLVTS